MGLPAAKQGDQIVALDLHLIQPPPPATPVLLPHPFAGLIDGLERDGLVTRHQSEEDRRATLVGLSPGGFALLDRILPPHFERVAALMQDLSPAERKDLSRLLAKVRTGVGRVRQLNGGLEALRAECAGG